MSARLLLFDLYAGGHHRAYLEMLARAWVTGSEQGRLDIALPAALLEDHRDFGDWLQAQDASRVRAIPMDVQLTEGDMGLRGVLRNDGVHGRMLSQVLREHTPGHVLAMYFDHLQASLARRAVGGHAPISGIYFRPSFHYPNEPLVTRARKRWLLRAALSNPRVHRVLSLDPYAAAALKDPRVVPVPDGVAFDRAGASPETVRALWGVSPGDRVLLFFGVISARKGIHEVLQALPGMQEPAVLVLSGRIPANERAQVLAAIGTCPRRVVLDERYVPDREVQDLFRAADVALVAYRRHLGSSNVLIRAAEAGTPVLGQDYGLMGRQIRDHRLGVAVPTGQPVTVARALDALLRGEQHLDSHRAAAFARDNTVERFTTQVFEAVLGGGSA